MLPLAILLVALSGVAPRTADPLAAARRLYNDGAYDQALSAAREAETNPATVSAARLVIGRVRLERFRRTAEGSDLSEARTALRSIDPRVLEPRERTELQVGLAELLYLDDRFGAAAELLEPILDAAATLGPQAHERALDWWATALDRQALAQPPELTDRSSIYSRIRNRMETELRTNVASASANYWIAASARALGDLDRAMSAASAGWVRAALTPDRGAALRADLDRLVVQAIIPDRATLLNAKDRRQVIAGMTAEWDSFKNAWVGK